MAYELDVYAKPLYYESTFSFFNPKKQVDCFEEIIKRFCRVRVRRFLDVACGPSLQLREIARRGFEAVGLDASKEMLKYLRGKAEKEGLKIETVQAEKVSFRLVERKRRRVVFRPATRKSRELKLKHQHDSIEKKIA
jgi:ubiquinone/menaquinone biosynthesis C-methylase UbiE